MGKETGDEVVITAVRTGEVVRVSHAERRRAAERGVRPAKKPSVEFANRIKGLNAVDRKELPRGASLPRAKR